MPELPEVETFARQLKPLVIGKKIIEFNIIPGGERLIGKQDLAWLQMKLSGDSIIEIGRHGKYLIFNLESGNRIVAHLRMSGKFIVSEGKLENKFNRLYLRFADQSYLNFIDIRKFATFEFEELEGSTNAQGKSRIARIGPDAVSEEFNVEYFHKATSRSKRSIYGLIMDQAVVAGIGNIYANETLFKSKVHPLQPANSLDKAQAKNMLEIIKSLLAWAINFKGTTLIDKTYSDAEGNFGEFANHLQVYGKKNAKCQICGTPLEQLRIQQRTVYYCPKCQIKRQA